MSRPSSERTGGSYVAFISIIWLFTEQAVNNSVCLLFFLSLAQAFLTSSPENTCAFNLAIKTCLNSIRRVPT